MIQCGGRPPRSGRNRLVVSMYEQVWVNVISGVLAGLLGVLATAAMVGIARTVRQREVQRFFGAARGKRVTIRLSNIYAREGGTVPVTIVLKGFTGPTTTAAEYHYALKIADNFTSQPAPEWLVRLVRILPVGRQVDLRLDVKIRLSPSPIGPFGGQRAIDSYTPVDDTEYARPDPAAVPSGTGSRLPAPVTDRISKLINHEGTLIVIGGPTYNAMTFYLLENCLEEHRHFTFLRHEMGESEFRRGIQVNHHHLRPDNTYAPERFYRSQTDDREAFVEYFILQRLPWDNGRLTVFLCAGTSTAATVAAVRQLAEWRSLERQFGRLPFAALYRLETDDKELTAVEWQSPEWWEPTLLWAWPRSAARHLAPPAHSLDDL